MKVRFVVRIPLVCVEFQIDNHRARDIFVEPFHEPKVLPSLVKENVEFWVGPSFGSLLSKPYTACPKRLPGKYYFSS